MGHKIRIYLGREQGYRRLRWGGYFSHSSPSGKSAFVAFNVSSSFLVTSTVGCPAAGRSCLWLRTLSRTSVGTHVMWPFLHSPVLSLVQASSSSSGLVTYTALFFWSSISISDVNDTQTSTSGKTCTGVSSSTISP